jgi:predicted aspartyl protease
MARLWNNLPRCVLLTVIVFLSASVVFSQSRNQKVASVPFDISNNLIILQVKVNGSSPLSFILDTGASASVINESRVKELGLQSQGQAAATTQGGSTEASFIRDVSLNLSGVEFPHMTLVAIRLSGLEAGLGRSVDGILGYEIFNRFVVEIDYASKTVTFYEPQSYRYSGRGEVLPIIIEDNTPFVRAKVAAADKQSFEGTFLINTGLTGTLAFNSPFVVQNKLLELIPNTKAITFGSIIAGGSSGRIGRVRSLQFGGFVISNPVANFSQDTTGDDSDVEYAGMIGSEVLRRFKLITDYSRKRITLEPNERFSAAYEFDMSGASLAAGGEGFKIFKVRSLIEDSPAAAAGLRVGDIVTAINGRPTTGMTLEQIRQMFRQSRRRYLLNIRRNDSPIRTRITTRRLI